MKNVFILGLGEIGNSIKRLYNGSKYVVKGYDIKEDIKPKFTGNIEVMHVCIPFNEEFYESVKIFALFYRPELIIINSTVPLLTTELLSKNISSHVVHSPVMGKHPNLTESMLTFKKIVAGYTEEAVELAVNHFKNISVDTVVYKSPEESEMAKLLSTTYYGTCIRYMQEVHRLCKEWGISFEDVYTKTNEIYNEGYTKFGDKQFVRPVLKYNGNGIGGHCIGNNAKLLKESKMLEKFADLILEEGHPDAN